MPYPTVEDRRNLALVTACAADPRPKYLIAALSGMPANVLGAYCTGRLHAPNHHRVALASTLGSSVAELFSEASR